MHEMADIQPAEVERQVASLSGTVRCRVQGNSRRAMLAHLHEELFERRSFRGNSQNYYSSSNSYVPVILQSGYGIPISLSLIYTVVARRLGLRADGINAPAHFLVRVADDTGTILVDPFHQGRQLNLDDARCLIETHSGGSVTFSGDMLRPATHRQWISRMLRNLIQIFHASRETQNAAAMVELLALLDGELPVE